MKLLVVVITLFASLTAFADNWSIINLDTGNREAPILTYGDQNWGRIVMGDNCIEGDLNSAYTELLINNSNKYTVEKTGISEKTEKGITVDVTGEYCTQTDGSHEDIFCTKWEVQTHEQLLRACKADQKFFPVGRQKGTFSYQVDFYTRAFSLIDQFYGGGLEIEKYRRSAYLNINFYKGAYSLDVDGGKNSDGIDDRIAAVRVALDPNVILNLKNGDRVNLKIVRQDIGGGSEKKLPLECSAQLESKFVVMSCVGGAFVSSTILLPFWALGFDDNSNNLPETKFAELKIANIKTGKRLQAGDDYKSLSQLWLKIKQGDQAKACVFRGSEKNIQLDLGKEAQVLLLCGKDCNTSIGANEDIHSVGVSRKGLTFAINKNVCAKESNGAQDSYECLKWKKVKESFLIPVCK